MHKIGIIDSGVGGLSIAKDILATKLDAEIYYQSDSLNVPWGNKKPSFISDQIKIMTEKLLGLNVTGIVIACNTATANSIEVLRSTYKIPFVGVEPFVKYAKLDRDPKHKIGLILTESTYHSKRFKELLGKYDPDKKILIRPLKNLASLIEDLQDKGFSDLKEEINLELAPLKEEKFTHLILGCTHYSLISYHLSQFLNVEIIDSTNAITKRVKDYFSISESKSINDFFYYSRNLNEPYLKLNFSSFNFQE